MHFRRTSAFTLIELMVVLAIVGVLAALAVGVAGQTQSRSRMVASAHDLRSRLSEGRMRAIRTGRFHKVCIFTDPLAGDTIGLGRVLTFGCNGLGSACGTGFICADAADSTTAYYNTIVDPQYLYADTFLQNAAAQLDRSCDPTLTTRWCPIADDGFQVEAKTRVSIAALAVAGVVNPANRIEVTYGPNGLVIPASSSASTASIRILNHDYCTSTPGACLTGNYKTGGITFQNLLDVEYLFGGATRVRR